MELLLDAAKWLLAKSDPMLIVCVLILAYWQRQTSRRLEEHLDPDPKNNPYPHPQCKEGETAYERLCRALETQRQENREDHQEIFRLLRRGEN
jgi:hypothetical protein